MLENYTCMDTTLDSSPDLYSYDWDHGNEAPRTIHVKHERRASKIHLIENFISPQECEAMEQAAVKILHRATVADGKGGSRYSENRKAMQAGIKVPWDKEKEGHPIAVLSRRVYDYTNHVLGLSINEKGQEDLMSIQYFGRGANDTEPDRYTPIAMGNAQVTHTSTGRVWQHWSCIVLWPMSEDTPTFVMLACTSNLRWVRAFSSPTLIPKHASWIPVSLSIPDAQYLREARKSSPSGCDGVSMNEIRGIVSIHSE